MERSGKNIEKRIVEIIGPPVLRFDLLLMTGAGHKSLPDTEAMHQEVGQHNIYALLHCNVHFIDNPRTMQHHQGGGRVRPAG